MSSYTIGDRVGAMLSADVDTVNLLGFGTFQGNEVPPPGITFMGIDLHSIGRANPKIQLDNGDVVWGCECWWGPEDAVRTAINGRRIVEVRIDSVRPKEDA